MKLLAITLLVTLSSCGHISAPNRNPSSASVMGMGITFEEIASQPDPRAEARAFVDRLLVLRLRANAWMQEVDQAFEGAGRPVDLFAHPSYLKLLVAHPLSDRMEHKITEFYREAREAAHVSPATPEERDHAEKAALVLAGVNDALMHAHHNVAERVLLNHLLRDLHEDAAATEPPHPLTVPLEGEELAVAAADSVEQAKRMVNDLPETDEVKEEVEYRATQLSDDLKEGQGRDPQSTIIMPSMGPNGNVDGMNFPRGTWALTFDDGPRPGITEKDLANLQAAKVPATFFWLAKNVQIYVDLVKKVQAAGYPVENHSWTHPQLNNPKDLARLNTNLDKEINQSFALDTKIYGKRPRFFRCPYGAGYRDPVIRGMIVKNGMIDVTWNVDSLDWQDPNPASVQKRVEAQMAANGRGVILFHDIHTPALTVVPNLVTKYKGKIRWVSIPQIVDELNGVKPAVKPAEKPSGFDAAFPNRPSSPTR